MINLDEIEKLAKLARIAVADEEKVKLQKDLESILAYVSELKGAPVSNEKEQSLVKNVLREDNNDPYKPNFLPIRPSQIHPCWFGQ